MIRYKKEGRGMGKLQNRRGSASFAAIAIAMLMTGNASAQTTSAPSSPATDRAQQEAEADRPANPTPVIDESQGAEDIIVTGSAIRGVAPIGSNLVSVGQE